MEQENRKEMWSDISIAMEMILASLLEEYQREYSAKLTLDDLRKLDGRPIFCVNLDSGKGAWAICCITELSKSWDIFLAGLARKGYFPVCTNKSSYGIVWVAYLYPPAGYIESSTVLMLRDLFQDGDKSVDKQEAPPENRDEPEFDHDKFIERLHRLLHRPVQGR